MRELPYAANAVADCGVVGCGAPAALRVLGDRGSAASYCAAHAQACGYGYALGERNRITEAAESVRRAVEQA